MKWHKWHLPVWLFIQIDKYIQHIGLGYKLGTLAFAPHKQFTKPYKNDTLLQGDAI